MTVQRGSLGPWADPHLIRLVTTSTAGLVAIVVAWYGASGSSNLEQQVWWLELAVAGTVLAATGHCMWLLSGRRAVGDRRRDLVSMAPAVDVGSMRTNARTRSDVTASLGHYVQATGMKHLHLADCPLVAGKDVRPARLDDGALCGMCAR